MVKMTVKLNGRLAKAIFLSPSIALTSLAFSQPMDDNLDPKALKAYRQFWDSFSAYEQSKAETSNVSSIA